MPVSLIVLYSLMYWFHTTLYTRILDHGDDGKTWGRRRVVVSSGKVGDGLRGAPPRWSIHEETLDKHIGEGGLMAHL